MRETAERIADGMWLKRTWYDASRVRSETVVQDRDGAPSNTVCGPHRDFDLDGRLVREVLIAPGSMPLSIDEYEQARRADPRLPPPTVQLPPPDAYAAFVAAQKCDPRYTAIRRDESDRFCAELLTTERRSRRRARAALHVRPQQSPPRRPQGRRPASVAATSRACAAPRSAKRLQSPV